MNFLYCSKTKSGTMHVHTNAYKAKNLYICFLRTKNETVVHIQKNLVYRKVIQSKEQYCQNKGGM